MKKIKSGRSAIFYLPRKIADLIPPDALFEAELTEDGVLFRFIGLEHEFPSVPKWARNGAA